MARYFAGIGDFNPRTTRAFFSSATNAPFFEWTEFSTLLDAELPSPPGNAAEFTRESIGAINSAIKSANLFHLLFLLASEYATLEQLQTVLSKGVVPWRHGLVFASVLRAAINTLLSPVAIGIHDVDVCAGATTMARLLLLERVVQNEPSVVSQAARQDVGAALLSFLSGCSYTPLTALYFSAPRPLSDSIRRVVDIQGCADPDCTVATGCNHFVICPPALSAHLYHFLIVTGNTSNPSDAYLPGVDFMSPFVKESSLGSCGTLGHVNDNCRGCGAGGYNTSRGMRCVRRADYDCEFIQLALRAAYDCVRLPVYPF